jgi:hypothetical protein
MKAVHNTNSYGLRLTNLAMVFFALTCIAHAQPQIATWSPDFGIRNSAFGFTVFSTFDPSVTIETCTNLAILTWTPLATNALTGGSCYFSDVD